MATVENFTVKVSTQGIEQLNRLAGAADSVNSKLNTLSSTILGVGFGAFVLGAANAADAMADLSDATGLTLGSITAFGLALEQSGGKFKNTERTILSFYNALETAADGGLKQQEAFKKVGVSLDDLRNLSEADIMNKTITGLAKMGEGSERSALAATLLGRSFRSVAPEKFAQELEKARGKAEEMAANQQKLADFNQSLESSYRALQLAVADVFGPLLESFKGIEAGSAIARAAIIGFTGALAIVVGGQVASGLLALVDLYKKLSSAIKGTVVAQTALTALGGPKGLALIAAAGLAATGVYLALDKAITDANESASQAPGGTALGGVVSKTPQTGSAGRTVVVAKTAEQKAVEESQRRISQINAEINRLREVQNSNVLDQIKQIEITSAADIAKAREEIFKRENLSKAQATAEFEAKRAEISLKSEVEIARLRAEAGRTLNEQVRSYSLGLAQKEREIALSREMIGMTAQDQQKRRETLAIEQQMLSAIEQARLVRNADPADTERAIQLIKEQAEATKQAIEANIEFQNSFEAGWSRAFAAYMDSAANASRQAEQIFSAVTQNMNSALDRFVDNGKISFNDLAQSMIRDILKIQLRAAAANLFAASGLGSIFGVQARAQGGPVNPNTPYLVGEKGPELLIPRSAGTIVPNASLSGQGPVGGNTYITNNISAIDSRSVAQLFAENRQTLFGNVEQARRELPLRTR